MERMREEFEGWVITRNVCIKYGAKLRTCHDGSYYDYRINDRWLAWKASRAALCVKLPENCKGMALTVDEFRAQLDTAGVGHE